MKTKLILLILSTFLFSLTLNAEGKIYSISLKQSEIENSIRTSLDPFVSRKDYVIKVRIKGVERTEKVKPRQAKTDQDGLSEDLPGFEPEAKKKVPKLTEIIGDTFWDIENMRIDLIMHKEISLSVDTFIRETVPVIAEMDRGRGDQFKFNPIVPKSLQQEVEEAQQAVEAQKAEEKAIKDAAETIESVTTPFEPRYYGLTGNQWMFVLIALIIIILIIVFLMYSRKMKRNMRILEEELEAEEDNKPQEADLLQESLENLKKARQQRLQKQEEELNNAVFRDENLQLTQKIITELVGRRDWAQALVEEYGSNKQDIEKFTQFIAVLGEKTSRKLFVDALGEEKYLEIEKMSDDVELDVQQERDLLREFQKSLYTKKLLSPEFFGEDPFSFFKDLTAGQIAFLVKDEPLNIKAIALSRLSGEDAASIIERFPKNVRNPLIVQLGQLSDLPLELVDKVAYDLAEKAKNVPDDTTASFDGVDAVIDLLGESNDTIRKEIINNLRTSDRKLSSSVESRFFLFDSIPVVPADVLTEVVRSLNPDDIVGAISHSSKQLKEKVVLCFPEKLRATIISSLKSKKLSEEEVKAKKKLVVFAMQKMAANNRIDLQQIASTWEKQGLRKAS